MYMYNNSRRNITSDAERKERVVSREKIGYRGRKNSRKRSAIQDQNIPDLSRLKTRELFILDAFYTFLISLVDENCVYIVRWKVMPH